jgi:hypothetical protein
VQGANRVPPRPNHPPDGSVRAPGAMTREFYRGTWSWAGGKPTAPSDNGRLLRVLRAENGMTSNMANAKKRATQSRLTSKPCHTASCGTACWQAVVMLQTRRTSTPCCTAARRVVRGLGPRFLPCKLVGPRGASQRVLREPGGKARPTDPRGPVGRLHRGILRRGGQQEEAAGEARVANRDVRRPNHRPDGAVRGRGDVRTQLA